MDSVSGTIYALSGVATATTAAGDARVLREGDVLRAGEVIQCEPCSTALLVHTASGALRAVGPGSHQLGTESWLQPEPAFAPLSKHTAVLDPAGLQSLAAQTNLYLASGRAAGMLEDLLQAEVPEVALIASDFAQTDGQDPDAEVIEALESVSDTVASVELFLQANTPGNGPASNLAAQLVELREHLETLRSAATGDSPDETVRLDTLMDTFAVAFRSVAAAESGALEAYASEMPGGPAWYGDGREMSLNPVIGGALQLESAGASKAAEPAYDALEMDQVLSLVTEHQLEDVLSFDRRGSQLEVSIRGEHAASEDSASAIVLESQYGVADAAPWDLGLSSGTTGPEGQV